MLLLLFEWSECSESTDTECVRICGLLEVIFDEPVDENEPLDEESSAPPVFATFFGKPKIPELRKIDVSLVLDVLDVELETFPSVTE